MILKVSANCQGFSQSHGQSIALKYLIILSLVFPTVLINENKIKFSVVKLQRQLHTSLISVGHKNVNWAKVPAKLEVAMKKLNILKSVTIKFTCN